MISHLEGVCCIVSATTFFKTIVLSYAIFLERMTPFCAAKFVGVYILNEWLAYKTHFYSSTFSGGNRKYAYFCIFILSYFEYNRLTYHSTDLRTDK